MAHADSNAENSCLKPTSPPVRPGHHPLMTKWTLWYEKPAGRGNSAAQYEANLTKIYTFSTVEDFWSLFFHLRDISELPLHSSCHLMRGDRKPLREDPENQRGGTWRLRCQKKHTSVVWLELLLAAIGEQFLDDVLPGDEVCGISMCIREEEDIVQVWNADASLSEGSSVLAHVHSLCPPYVHLSEEFYKTNQSQIGV